MSQIAALHVEMCVKLFQVGAIKGRWYGAIEHSCVT